MAGFQAPDDIWIDDPAEDIDIKFEDVKTAPVGRWTFSIVVTVSFHGEAELKHYVNGFQTIGATCLADSRILLRLDCESALSIKPNGLATEFSLTPKVNNVKLELLDFDLHRVGKTLKGDGALQLGDDLRGEIKKLMKKNEPVVRDQANAAISKSIAEGKLRFTPFKLLDASPFARKGAD